MSTRQHRGRGSRVLLGIFALLCTAAPGRGQEQPHLHFPRPQGAFHWEMSAGVTLLTVPRDIAEEEINKAPALDLDAVIGLPWQFSFHGRAIVQYITNEFRFGASWSHSFGRFGIAAGDDASFWFGAMTIDGFDNSMSGWMNYPYVAVGYDADGVLISLKGEAMLMLAQRSFAGENDLGSNRNAIAGGAVTVMLEQPFWKNTHLALGARISLTQFHPQTWFAFSAFSRRLLFSELLFGVIL